MKTGLVLIAIVAVTFLPAPPHLQALDPSLDVSQYAHTAWTGREGFSVGATFAMAQTPDGYLWLGTEFGLYRFDGVHAVAWQPPAGQKLPNRPYALLVTRDGTLWIGTFTGLASWNGTKLTEYPEISGQFVTSLLEDHEGTVWAGVINAPNTHAGRLCAIQSGEVHCYDQDGAFGSFVWSLAEDSSGNLWAGAESGLWRWKPGLPKRYATSTRVGDLAVSGDGHLIVGMSAGGLEKFVADKLDRFPLHSATHRNALLSEREIDANKLLWDRDGGLWIGTHQKGLIHIHNGRTDVFTASDGLSGDIGCSLFQDREGNIWFGSSRGVDRFRELPVATIPAKPSLPTGYPLSLLAGNDGSIWVGTHDGLVKWANGQATLYRKANARQDDSVQSLFVDYRGRIWATFNDRRLWYFKDDKMVATNVVIPSSEVHSITGDQEGNLWLAGNLALSHIRNGRLVENVPWSALGHQQQAKIVVFDPDRGGVWLAFRYHGGLLNFKDGHVRASYTSADGLGAGLVASIQLDHDGALWAATQEGGLSRIKDGHINTLTTNNGLPCNTIHWSVETDDRSLWLYMACGLVRITRSEVQAWIADPKHRIETTLWDATDGVTLRAASPGFFNPPVAKSSDGKLWFNTGEGIAVVDPRNLAVNNVVPPVHIEQVIADHKSYWQNLPGAAVSRLRLPPQIRDLQIDYTVLSLVAPDKAHFKYKLEGQDRDWREVVNDRKAQYSNLAPGSYRFRVIASNNSGLWNEQGDELDFSIAPAYYQTNWFRAFCALLFLCLTWALYELRVRQLHRHFEMTLEARVGERTRIARELHDTLLQSFQGLLLRFQTVTELLPERAVEAKDRLDGAIDQAADAITEGRNAVQGLRISITQRNDLAMGISTLGEELASGSNHDRSTGFRVTVEGQACNLHPIVRDEIYKIAAEALRNAFRHAQARRVEVEIRYDNDQFRLRVRDDGKGMDPAAVSTQGSEGHYGLHGMRERATVIKGKLVVWSEVDAGTEVELRVPASVAYPADRKRSWFLWKSAGKSQVS